LIENMNKNELKFELDKLTSKGKKTNEKLSNENLICLEAKENNEVGEEGEEDTDTNTHFDVNSLMLNDFLNDMIPYELLQKSDGIKSIITIEEEILKHCNFEKESNTATLSTILKYFLTLKQKFIKDKNVSADSIKYIFSGKKNAFSEIEKRKLVTIITSILCIQLFIDDDLSDTSLLFNIFDKEFHSIILSMGFLYGVFEKGFNTVVEYLKEEEGQFKLYYFVLETIFKMKKNSSIANNKIMLKWFLKNKQSEKKTVNDNENKDEQLGNNIDDLVGWLKNVWKEYANENKASINPYSYSNYNSVFGEETVLGVTFVKDLGKRKTNTSYENEKVSKKPKNNSNTLSSSSSPRYSSRSSSSSNLGKNSYSLGVKEEPY